MTSKPSVAGKDQAEFPSPEPILTFEPNVTVRPIQMSDAPSMAYHANNKKISIRLSKAFPYPYKVEDAQAFISLRLSPERQIASGAFDVETGDGTGPKLPTVYAICIDDQCVGTLGLVFQSDATCRVASIGYWIGEEFWSKGIISKVVPAFVRWGFETFGRLMRLEGGVYEGNPASCRILEKCGMKYAHYYEKSIWKEKKLIGSHLYELVRED